MARVRLGLALPIVIDLLGACAPQPQIPRADTGAEPVTFNNQIVYLFTRVLDLPSIWVPYAPHDEPITLPTRASRWRASSTASAPRRWHSSKSPPRRLPGLLTREGAKSWV